MKTAYASIYYCIICLIAIEGISIGQGAPFVPNDSYFFTDSPPGFSGQWHLDRQNGPALIDVNIRGAWNRGLTGLGITIGIVDDGVDPTHPDLAPNIETSLSRDFSTNSAPATMGPLGTATAGIAAGRGGNSIGITGVAPSAGIAIHRIPRGPPSLDYLYNEPLDLQYAAATVWQGESGDAAIYIKSHSYTEAFAYYRPYVSMPHLVAATRASTLDGVIHVRSAVDSRHAHDAAWALVPYFPGGLDIIVARDGNANKVAANNIPETIVVGGVNHLGVFTSSSNFGSNLFVSAP